MRNGKPSRSWIVSSGHLEFFSEMVKANTEGILVSVETSYQPTHSARAGQHFFAYRITVENLGGYTVQLLRRHWHIVEGDGSRREVEGEGVVGEQPVISPGQKHRYISGCGFSSEIGKMYGTFLMKREVDGHEFRAEIPPFVMVVPHKLN
jgi:ApaG protein